METWKLERFKERINAMLNEIDNEIKNKSSEIPKEDLEETSFWDLKISAKIKGEKRKNHKVELNYSYRVKKNEKCNCTYYNSHSKPCVHLVKLANYALEKINEELEKKAKKEKEELNNQLPKSQQRTNIQTNSNVDNLSRIKHSNIYHEEKEENEEEEEEDSGFNKSFRIPTNNISHKRQEDHDKRKLYLESINPLNINSNLNSNSIGSNPFMSQHNLHSHNLLQNQNSNLRHASIQSNPFLSNNSNLNINSNVNYNYNNFNSSFNPFHDNKSQINGNPFLGREVKPNPFSNNFNFSRINSLSEDFNNQRNNFMHNAFSYNSQQQQPNFDSNRIDNSKFNIENNIEKIKDENLKNIINDYKQSKYFQPGETIGISKLNNEWVVINKIVKQRKEEKEEKEKKTQLNFSLPKGKSLEDYELSYILSIESISTEYIKAYQIFENGNVLECLYAKPDLIVGKVLGSNKTLKIKIIYTGENLICYCTCGVTKEENSICKHILAVSIYFDDFYDKVIIKPVEDKRINENDFSVLNPDETESDSDGNESNVSCNKSNLSEKSQNNNSDFSDSPTLTEQEFMNFSMAVQFSNTRSNFTYRMPNKSTISKVKKEIDKDELYKGLMYISNICENKLFSIEECSEKILNVIFKTLDVLKKRIKYTNIKKNIECLLMIINFFFNDISKYLDYDEILEEILIKIADIYKIFKTISDVEHLNLFKEKLKEKCSRMKVKFNVYTEITEEK